MFKNVLFVPGQPRVLPLTAIKAADIGLDLLMRLFVGFPVAVGVEPQFTEVTLEGSFLGVSSDV